MTRKPRNAAKPDTPKGGKAAQRRELNKKIRQEASREAISRGMTLAALERQHQELDGLREDSAEQRRGLMQFHRDVDAYAAKLARTKKLDPESTKAELQLYLGEFQKQRNYTTALSIGLSNLEIRAIEAKTRIKTKLLDKIIPNATPEVLNNPNSPLGALAQTLAGMFQQERDE